MGCKIPLSFAFLTSLTACTGSIYLPGGDPTAGKLVFTESQCYNCHEVVGDEYPEPSAITPTFVALGSPDHKKPRSYLVESIIAPSHEFARPLPPPGQIVGESGIRSGDVSRMKDYSETLTVRQLLDLVAYLEELQKGSR